MKDKKSIVILYSKGLYDTNALQLADAIANNNSDCHVIAIGDDKYTNFGRGKSIRLTYTFSIRNARWIYGTYSNMTVKKKAPNKALKNIKADPSERSGFNKFMYDMTCRYHKVKNILRRYEPEIVLCFTPSVLKTAIKANEQLRMYTTKIYACLTDFGFDMRFFNRRCAGYVVQNYDVQKKLISLGVDEDKTFVTSLLCENDNDYDVPTIKKEIGIRNEKPNLLLIGGRYGSNLIKNALSYLVNYTDNFNIIVLTGGSKTIVNVAKHLVKGDEGVFVIDKIDDIVKVYTVADIVVATPTTCICSEVVSMGKQLILLKSTGKIEKDNAKYLLSHNVALDGSNKEKLIVSISNIIKNDLKPLFVDDFIKVGAIDNLVDFLMKKASEIFAEKKILLAEKKLQENDDTDADNIEEVDMAEEVPNDIENIQAVDGEIIDEYNDIEEN